VALAPDGSFYISDTSNNRIQHLDTDGNMLHAWGSFADISQGAAPGGTFYEPWGIAVGKDGSVYVADTWNHRIQKFTAEGEFVNMWGYFGQADTPFAIWGPRDIAIDEAGNLFITDTGNKRIVIYDSNGNYVNQFGSVLEAVNLMSQLVRAEWQFIYTAYLKQRLKVMVAEAVALTYLYDGGCPWYGQSLDNKPYLSVDTTATLHH
jgi:hypothetical protein